MTNKEEYNRIYKIGFDNAKREILEDVEKIIDREFDEGDEYITYAEEVLFNNGDIKKMLYTPVGIYFGTKIKILKKLKEYKEKE